MIACPWNPITARVIIARNIQPQPLFISLPFRRRYWDRTSDLFLVGEALVPTELSTLILPALADLRITFIKAQTGQITTVTLAAHAILIDSHDSS